jgi:hypothetical protein
MGKHTIDGGWGRNGNSGQQGEESDRELHDGGIELKERVVLRQDKSFLFFKE